MSSPRYCSCRHHCCEGYLEGFGEPNLNHIPTVAKHFQVSKEAAARSYATYHRENIAIVVIKDGIVRRIHKGPTFPWVTARYGKSVPQGSIFHRKLAKRTASDILGTIPDTGSM